MSTERETQGPAELAPGAPPRVGPRSELKLHLDEDEARATLAWCAERLAPDSHAAGPVSGLYLVESVYFDTPERHAVADAAFPKYRARRYDGAEESLHIEEKFSHSPRVWKRRQAVSPAALDVLVGCGTGARSVAECPGHAWFADRFARLALTPALFVRYSRVAFVGPGDLRVTLDREVDVATTTAAELFEPLGAVRRLDVTALLEVKFMGAPPLVARELLARHGEPVGFSKYRSGMRVSGT